MSLILNIIREKYFVTEKKIHLHFVCHIMCCQHCLIVGWADLVYILVIRVIIAPRRVKIW